MGVCSALVPYSSPQVTPKFKKNKYVVRLKTKAFFIFFFLNRSLKIMEKLALTEILPLRLKKLLIRKSVEGLFNAIWCNR